MTQPCGCRQCLRDLDAREPQQVHGFLFAREMTTFVVCSICGNKRCPHATDHRLVCTHSNEAGQEGSALGIPLRSQAVIPRTIMERFTCFRRNMSARDTHNAAQKNSDDLPQFEGVIWSDQTVTIRWLTECRSTSVWDSIEDMLTIHGHPEYGTEFVWHDGEEPSEWTAQVAEFNRKASE